MGAILKRRSMLSAQRAGAFLLDLIEPNGIAFGVFLKIYPVSADGFFRTIQQDGIVSAELLIIFVFMVCFSNSNSV